MSAILKEGISFDGYDSEVSEVSTKVDYSKNDTDVIISHYENKLNGSIATKALNASKKGIPPVFTQEEWLYLSKKSSPANPDTEITVITPSPTITLKKGNTELNIKNAATLVQKMQEMYPNGMSEDSREDFFRQPFIEKSIEEGLKNLLPVAPPEVKTVNKNAYEIRNEVLNMAFEFLKWQTELGIVNITTGKKADPSYVNIPRVDDVLDIAKKFYSFVENRR